MISSLLRDGTEDLKNYLLRVAPPGKWKYHSSVVTDEDTSQLIADAVRSKVLDNLSEEVPYGITCKIDLVEVNEVGTICIRVTLLCKEKRWVKVVLGHQGVHLTQIAKDASQELRNLFQQEVYIRINVASAK
ncbi:unnamed protein product [Soboliphyme baturini]|uniref:KH type-2 domain-containing protein n=1 Tax=Soboliphyme baturini TaxID=241478 RepID=A0A183J2J3_9BILA|nr:unnamed protein product [Soboliphyme baturini]